MSDPDSTDPRSIPFVDLPLQNARVAEEVRAGIDRVLRSSSFVLGPEVEEFERDYADFCGTDHAIGVANGTEAIELGLRAAGVGPGDDVVLPANSFVATAEAVMRAGARPVFAECRDDFLIDPVDVEALLGPRTAAVIGVDLYGQCAPFDELRRVVGSRLLVEDAAQSHGAERFGRRAGSLADVAATSFYPGKNLGAFGDAGAVTTDDPLLADLVRKLRNHGGIRRYEHTVLGINSRLDSLQAAVLNAKLPHLDAWNGERRRAAELYGELLRGVAGVTTPGVAPGNTHVYHLYVVLVEQRDRVQDELAAAGIGVGVHYPDPIHRQPAFHRIPHARRILPRTEAFAARALSLPMFPGITPAQQATVAECLIEALQPDAAALMTGVRS